MARVGALRLRLIAYRRLRVEDAPLIVLARFGAWRSSLIDLYGTFWCPPIQINRLPASERRGRSFERSGMFRCLAIQLNRFYSTSRCTAIQINRLLTPERRERSFERFGTFRCMALQLDGLLRHVSVPFD